MVSEILLFIQQHLQKVIFLTISGLIIRQTLLLLGQHWVRGYHHLATYTILPVIAYVVTSVISNNLALSLGMIGALSIVRFRNPVKSPLELIMFFALLTLGIAASVNILWAIFLFLFIFIVFISIEILDNFFKLFDRKAYEISFSEGNEVNILEISSASKLEFLDNNKNIKSFNFDSDNNEWSYKIIFNKRDDVKDLISKLENIDKCSFNVHYI